MFITHHLLAPTTICTAALLISLLACAAPTPVAVETTTPRPTSQAPPTTSAPPTPMPETPTVPPALPTPLPTATPLPPGHPPYHDRADPLSLLASYYNALNRQEYRRAWQYWESPPNPSYEDFVQGYAETASVLLAVSPPTWIEGAAGSQYASIPTMLVATHLDGSRHTFAGCYVTRRSNPGIDGVSPDTGWWLYSATVAPTPANTTDATLLAHACEFAQPDLVYHDREGPLRLLASYFNAIDHRDYGRAWGYWKNPPNPSYEDFVHGYAETASVLLVVRPPVRVEGAAGSRYASIPALLIATHTDGSRHAFVACYVTWRVNPQIPGAIDVGWSLYGAAVTAAPGDVADVTLLAQACISGDK